MKHNGDTLIIIAWVIGALVFVVTLLWLVQIIH